ncbi:MAG TPA: CsgG/HfaB family protein [Spirochaetota bacterium]|nr:CsgG/HfaB family protein [Spirochaetota bacterium]HNT09481.1 CsgG/HfaB family protein [Spirochaetota bacterium]
MKKLALIGIVLAGMAAFASCRGGVDVVISRHGNPEEIRKVAIFNLKLQNRGSYSTGDRVSDLLMHEFLKLGYDVVERTEIERLVKEQKLSVSGFIDPREAVAIGKLSGADTIVTGTGHLVSRDSDVLSYLVIKVISLRSGSVIMTANLRKNMSISDAVTEMSRSIKKCLDERAAAQKGAPK